MRFLLIISAFFISFSATSQVKFEIIYGGTGYDHARSVWQTADSGYIVTGYSNFSGVTDTQVFLLKTDSAGGIQWFRFYGDEEIQAGMCVQQTLDGGYIVGGYTNENISNEYDFLLMKFNQDGDLTWKKTYGGEDWDLGEYVEQTFDGGYIIGGSTFSTGNGGEDGYLIKTDANGDMVWSKTYGGALDDQFKTVKQCADSGFVAIGRSNSLSIDNEDIYVVRTDKLGDTIWATTLGNVNDDYGKSIVENTDSTFVLISVQNDPNDELNKAYLVKLDKQGDEVWSQIFGTVAGDEPSTLKSVPWGGYVYSAYNEGGTGAGGKDMFILKTNNDGFFEYARTYGGAGDDMAFSMQVTNDNGFIIAGETNSYGDGLVNVYLIKTDSLGASSGTVVIGLDEKPENIEAGVYPNPADEAVNIVLPEKVINENVSLNLFNISGQLIQNSALEKNTTSTIDVSKLPSGIYFMQLVGESFMSRKKIIIAH